MIPTDQSVTNETGMTIRVIAGFVRLSIKAIAAGQRGFIARVAVGFLPSSSTGGEADGLSLHE
jgi:hypothetical protein